jgi:tetratricopeptide (TPR) repeat protein
MIYGNYLLKLDGRIDDAIEQYDEAVKLQPENANINYNLGLVYLKKKDYEQSIVYAKKAYELGFPLPGLRNKLMKTGKWDGNLDENIDVEP